MKFLYLWMVLGVLLALSFEGIYKFQSENLQKEAEKLEKNTRVAYKMAFTYFRNGKPLWLFKGKKVDMSQGGKTIVYQFEAKNLQRFLKVVSEKAIYFKRKQLLLLQGEVKIWLKKKNEPIEVKTPLAYLDLKNKVVYNTPDQKVVIEEPYRILMGNGFRYNLKTGELIILKNVQTFIKPRGS